uniref:Calponin-homology (CH) domain-containing protein n=1 Tax=Mesocestoides corti TaxID=53468 RepID=A0A5K3F6P8_MESCO
MAQINSTAESAREHAYLSWINSKISAVCPGMKLNSLDDEAMRNGTALAELIDAASASRVLLTSPCTSSAIKVSNVREILRHLKELNVPVASINPEDIVNGNKSSIMRLLLAISAAFMPSHIHDVKHEIRDRHSVFGGQRVWHHITNIGPEVAAPERRLFPTTYRIQPITIHRLVPTVRPPLLHVSAAPAANHLQHYQTHHLHHQQHQQQLKNATTSFSLARRLSSHIYNRHAPGVDGHKKTAAQQQRSCENLVLTEEQPSPIRASKSLSALHGRTFVSKLVIPHLRNGRASSRSNKDQKSIVSKSVSATRGRLNRGTSDGYVNHGFSDSPGIAGAPTSSSGPPLAQMAKLRFDLAGVKSELLQLQELVCALCRSCHATSPTSPSFGFFTTVLPESSRKIHHAPGPQFKAFYTQDPIVE